MKMNVRDINISLIERCHREFLLFSMHNARAQYFANPYMQTINIFVHSVQLDDLHPLAVYHVAVIGQDWENYHFLEFRCAFHQDMLTTKFDRISIRMQKLYLMVDIRLLSDFIRFLLPKAFQKIVPPDTSSSVLSGIPVSVEALTVHETAFVISSRTSTGRPSSAPLVDPKMKFYLNISNFEVSIPLSRSALDDINALELRRALFEPYWKVITDQSWSAIRSIDLIGWKSVIDRSYSGPLQRRSIDWGSSLPKRRARVMPRNQIRAFDSESSLFQYQIQKSYAKGKYAAESIFAIFHQSPKSSVSPENTSSL
jgi:hypothetical protein